MPKWNKCSQKAREHKAAKWGEIMSAICTYAKEISTNLTYEDSGDDFDDSASEDFETGPAYGRRALNSWQAAYAVKKYKSHRHIPANIMMDINIISWGANL